MEGRPGYPLQAWRQRENVSAADLAAEIRVTKFTVARYEMGRMPKQPFLDRIVIATNGEVTANAWLGEKAIRAILEATRASTGGL